MSFEKVAEQDGREVWLAVLARPGEAASWSGPDLKDGGVLLFLDAETWDADGLDAFVEAVLRLGPSEIAVSGTAGDEVKDAFDQELKLHPLPRPVSVTVREEEELDESVWYMFFATIDRGAPAGPRQPPLVVAFADGDSRADAFKSIAARFGAAMNEVLERQ